MLTSKNCINFLGMNSSFNESCLSINTTGHWLPTPCDALNPLVCKKPYIATTASTPMPTYFRFFNQSKTWREAEVYCEEQQGYLAPIHSLTELVDIRKDTPMAAKYWLGGSTGDNGSFEWIDGKISNYTNFAPGKSCCFFKVKPKPKIQVASKNSSMPDQEAARTQIYHFRYNHSFEF